METLVPPTVRQARWFIVGGLVAAVMGVIRIVGFVNYGGLVALVMGTVFVGLAIASLAAGIVRIRRGDDPDGTSRRVSP